MSYPPEHDSNLVYTNKLDLDKLPGSKEFIEPLKTAPKEKAMGGKIQTEYRGGGAVNLGNYKGQF